MKNLKENISNILGNENGGPNVEQVVGIAVALCVGAGLFVFGKVVYGWFNGNAKSSVNAITLPADSEWDLNV